MFSLEGYSQDAESLIKEPQNKSTVRSMIHAGINLSTDVSASREFRKPSIGYYAGLGAEFKFYGDFKVRSGVTYNRRNYGYEARNIQQDYGLQLISVPLLFEYQIAAFNIFAGRHYNYLLKAEVEFPNADPFEVTDRFSKITGGTDFGASVEFFKSKRVVRLELHIMFGNDIWTSNVGIVAVL